MDLIMKGVRWVLWLLCKGCFFLVDSIFNIIQPIITFNIADPSVGVLWDWWLGLCCFIGLLIFIRLIAMYLKTTIDEDYRLKIDPVNIIFRMGAIVAILVFLPMIVQYVCSMGSHFLNQSGKLFTTETSIVYDHYYSNDEETNKKIKQIYEAYEGMPSQLIVSSASNGKYPPYQLIDINSTSGGMDSWLDGVPVLDGLFDITSGLIGADGDFVYFPDTTMLIFLIVEAVCAAYMFVLMAIQISQRIIGIGLKILISPIPISGLINEEDKSFGLWCKLLTADILSNIIQYMLLLFVLMIISTQAVQNMGIVAQAIFFLGGMLAVIVGPNSVAQLIGGDGMGLNQSMQAMQTLTAMNGMSNTALRAVGSAIGLGASLGVYGAGRAMGGISLGQGVEGANSAGGMGMGEENGNPLSSGGLFGSAPGENFMDNLTGQSGLGATGSTQSSSATLPPTEKQRNAAERLNVDIEGMNRGQASQALQKAGMDRSYWDGMNFKDKQYGTGTGTVNSSAGNYSHANGAVDAFPEEEPSSGSYAYGMNQGSASISSSTGNDFVDNMESASNPSSSEEGQTVNNTPISNEESPMQDSQQQGFRLTREGSFARRIADTPSTKARVATAIGRSMYLASGQRLMGSRTIQRHGKFIARNTPMQTFSNIKRGIQDARKSTASMTNTNDPIDIQEIWEDSKEPNLFEEDMNERNEM